MDYSRPALADRLAAAYALGTLRGAARRRLEALLPSHPALRDAVRAWDERLMPLSTALVPVQPSGNVWRRVSERISGNGSLASAAGPTSPAGEGVWSSLAFWRALTGFAGAAAIGLAVLLAAPRAVPPPIIVVLAPTGAAGAVPGPAGAAIVASISGDRATLVVRPVAAVAAPAGRSLELWAVPPGGAPRSLGLVPGGSATVALKGGALAGSDTLAVSVEPTGGSPTGAPTGPVVYAGKFTP